MLNFGGVVIFFERKIPCIGPPTQDFQLVNEVFFFRDSILKLCQSSWWLASWEVNLKYTKTYQHIFLQKRGVVVVRAISSGWGRDFSTSLGHGFNLPSPNVGPLRNKGFFRALLRKPMLDKPLKKALFLAHLGVCISWSSVCFRIMVPQLYRGDESYDTFSLKVFQQ